MYWFVCMCIHASLFCNVMKRDINAEEREIEEERGYLASTAKKKWIIIIIMIIIKAERLSPSSLF